jgi:hypothetical protein
MEPGHDVARVPFQLRSVRLLLQPLGERVEIGVEPDHEVIGQDAADVGIDDRRRGRAQHRGLVAREHREEGLGLGSVQGVKPPSRGKVASRATRTLPELVVVVDVPAAEPLRQGNADGALPRPHEADQDHVARSMHHNVVPAVVGREQFSRYSLCPTSG